MYQGPYIEDHLFRPCVTLKVALKWRDIYIENSRVALLMASFKMQGIVKWKGLKSCHYMYIYHVYMYMPLHVIIYTYTWCMRIADKVGIH